MSDTNFRLFDTYKKNIVPINPNEPGKIKLYSCGPTVYGYQHIGNMRAVWLASTLVDFLDLLGLETQWILNITDVGHLVGDGDDGQNTVDGEDKLEKGAKKEGKSVQEIIQFYQSDYELQCGQLNINIPIVKNYPRATEYIPEQMILALTLLKNKKAYLLDDGIYFDSEANRDLVVPFEINIGDNDFTGRDIKNTIKNPADFALWKFVSSDSLQKWRFENFPQAMEVVNTLYDFNLTQPNIADKNGKKPVLNPATGEYSTIHELKKQWGSPGWHSECVAMICKLANGGFPPILDKNSFVIDIHLGGEDHIDIHHKNEILQSKALGFHLSNHWIHNKFVTVDGKKMSKSVGNIYMISGQKSVTGVESLVENGFDPLAYRLMMMEHHFTSQLDFTWDKLQQSQNRLYNLRKETAKIISFGKTQKTVEQTSSNPEKSQLNSLLSPLRDNLNIPKFLEHYEHLVNQASNNIKTQQLTEPGILETLIYLDQKFLKLDLFPQIADELTALAEERLLAKQNKDYVLSDQIREKISILDFQIDDYTWGYGLWKKTN